jgi:hypothetical protein
MIEHIMRAVTAFSQRLVVSSQGASSPTVIPSKSSQTSRFRGLPWGDAGRAEGDLADRSGGPQHRFSQRRCRLCLL